MSTNDKKANLTPLLNVTSGTEELKEQTETSEGSASKRDSCESHQLSPGETKTAAAESHSDPTPETTSSELSISNESHGTSCEADPPSIFKEASSTNDLTDVTDDSTDVSESVRKVHFTTSPDQAYSPLSPKASEVSEEDNNLVVAGASGGLTTENIAAAAESENSVEHSGAIANGGCCPEHRGILGYFRISMMYLRESKFLLPFQFLLLCLPVSSGFMGAKYMEKCPVSPAIPLLLFMMGIIGTFVICSRIYSIFKKALFPHSDWSGQVRIGLVSGLLMLTILYTTELACFFIAVPSFKSGDSNYCQETFYTFVFYINYISIALVILLLLLHCPGSRPCPSIDQVRQQ